MKFGENLPRGFRGNFVQRCGQMTDGWTDDKWSQWLILRRTLGLEAIFETLLGCLEYKGFSQAPESDTRTRRVLPWGHPGVKTCEVKYNGIVVVCCHFLLLTLSSLQTNTDTSANRSLTNTFANSADSDEAARNEPSHQDLHCLPLLLIFDWNPLCKNRYVQIQRWKSPFKKLGMKGSKPLLVSSEGCVQRMCFFPGFWIVLDSYYTERNKKKKH